MKRLRFFLWSLWVAITNRRRNRRMLRLLEKWEREPDGDFDADGIEPLELRHYEELYSRWLISPMHPANGAPVDVRQWAVSTADTDSGAD